MLAQIGSSLIGVALVLVPLIWLGGFAGKNRDYYYSGLFPAVVAFVPVLFVYFPISQLYPPAAATWVAMLAVAPLVEELVRIWFFQRAGPPAKSIHWVLVGLGFGLFEGLLKFNDLLALVFMRNELPARMLVWPIAPVALHLFLSVVACWTLRAGWSAPKVFVLTWTIHFAHNTSALLLPNETGHIADPLIRAAIYIALTALLLSLARRGDPVTSTPPHANTAQ